MSRTGSDKAITVTGKGEVLAGSPSRLEDYRAEDSWVLGRMAADHIARHGYEEARVEFGHEGLRVEIPHEYSDGRITHEYVVDEAGEVYARHSLPTSEKDFSKGSVDALHHHLLENEFKRLVARANKVVWFAEEIMDIHGRNPEVAEDILKEYRWGPVLDPQNLARNVTALNREDDGPRVLEEAMVEAGFGATDYVLEDEYDSIYEALLDRAAAGERVGTLDFEEGTKGRSLKDFYSEGRKGEEMQDIYRKEINRVIRKVCRETDMEIETL